MIERLVESIELEELPRERSEDRETSGTRRAG